jgi:hypothetical protein
MIRRARILDLDQMMEIQLANYPSNLIEGMDTFESIVNLGMSIVYVDIDNSSNVLGFLLAHEIENGRVPRLNEYVRSVNNNVNNNTLQYYIHDLSVRVKGIGIGSRLVKYFLENVVASSPRHLVTIVAVNGAEGFWEKHGFGTSPISTTFTLDSYGPACTVMSRHK